MPRYIDNLAELTEMQRGVGIDEVVDVWPETCVSRVSQIGVGDLIAVKWSQQKRSHEFTWCTVLSNSPIDPTSAKITLMHEQAAPSHVTYGMTLHDADHSSTWLVYNFDNAAEHKWKICNFVSEVNRPPTDYANMQEWCEGYQVLADCYTDRDGVIPELLIDSLKPLPGDFQSTVPDSEVGEDYNKANTFITNNEEWNTHVYSDEQECINYFAGWSDEYRNMHDYYGGWI